MVVNAYRMNVSKAVPVHKHELKFFKRVTRMVDGNPEPMEKDLSKG